MPRPPSYGAVSLELHCMGFVEDYAASSASRIDTLLAELASTC
jgi:hypothetical protein